MKNKKSLLEEVNKTWSVVKNLREAAQVAGAQPVQSTPQVNQNNQGQRAPQAQPAAQPAAQPEAQPAVQQNPQQIQNNITTTMDQGMNALLQQLPGILKNFTAADGDKDNQLDVPGQPQTAQSQAQNKDTQPTEQSPQSQQSQKPVQESRDLKFDDSKFKSHLDEELNEGGIIGLVASAPAIMQLGGKFLSWTGKKANSQVMQKWGSTIADAGHNLHHKYIGALEKVVAPFMKGQSQEAVHQAAEAMFMTLVAGLFAGGLAAPNALSGVKAKELASYVQKNAPKVLGALGFA